MKIKESLAYEGRKPQSRRKLSLIIDDIQLDENYLIADLYSKKILIYRIVITQTGYMHYDYQTEKIDKKSMWENPKRSMLKEAYVTDKDLLKLKKFKKNIKLYEKLYSDKEAVDIVQYLEGNVKRFLENKSLERKNEEKEELFELIPPIPENFFDSIERNADRGNIIYYKRHGRYADYKCCQCGKQYTLRNAEYEGIEPVKVYPIPKQMETMQCPECGKYAVLYPLGRAKKTFQDFYTILYQVAADETFIARRFYTIISRDQYGPYEIKTTETDRIFLRKGYTRQYWYSSYNSKWYSEKNISFNQVNTLYEYGYDNIKNSCLKYMPDDLYKLRMSGGESRSRINMMRFETAMSYAWCPQLEALFKCGLTKICIRIMWNGGHTRDISKKEKELHKILKINKQQFNYIMMKPEDCTFNTLEMLHFADKNNIPVRKYSALSKMWRTDTCEHIRYLIRFQSFDKLYNTLQKYISDGHYGIMYEVIREYSDYLHEREAQGDDLNNSVYLRPRDLYDTYTRLRIEAEQKRDNEYIDKMMEKYPAIKARSEKIPKKYTFECDGLIIRPAQDAREIVLEGRILHHCVGSDGQRYMKNFNEGKAWIMMVRHENAPDVPFVTVELKDNKIAQWYGEHDTKPDEEHVNVFLDKYIEHLNEKRAEIRITA